MLLIAIYLCFTVVKSYHLNIAYFKDTSNTYFDDFLKPYSDKRPNITINEVITSGFTTTAYYDEQIEKEVKEKNTAIILAECNDLLIKSNSTYITSDKVLIICMNEVSVGRCNKHFISGVSVIPLILNTANYDGNVAFVYQNTELDRFYEERFNKSVSYFGVNVVGYLNEAGNIQNFFTSLNGYDKCMIIMRNNDETEINTFLTVRQSSTGSNADNLANFPVVFLPGSINYKDYSPTLGREHNFFVTGYTGFEDNELVGYYKGNYTGKFNDASDAMFTYVFALLDKIQYVAETYPSDKIYPLLSLMYNEPIEYPGGIMYLTPNNYLSVPFKFVETNGESPTYPTDGSTLEYGYETEVKYLIEAVTDFRVDEFYNEIDTEVCDFLQNSEDGFATLEMFAIGFVLDMSSHKNRLIKIFIEKLMRNYGKQMKAILIDVKESSVSQTINTIKDYHNNYEMSSIFMFTSPEIMHNISTSIRGLDIQIFYMNEAAGDTCEDNVIYGNIETSAYSIIASTYLQKNNYYGKIAIISSTTEYGTISRKILYNDLIDRGFFENRIGYFEMADTSENQARNATANIKLMTMGDYNHTAIIVVTEGGYIPSIMKVLHNESMTFENNFTVIVYGLDETYVDEMKNSKEPIDYAGYFFIAHSSTMMESKVLDPYRTYYKEFLGRDIPIFSELGLITNIVSLLVQAIESSSSYLPSLYKNYIFHQAVKTPAYDQYELYYSSHAQAKLGVYQFTKDVNSTEIMRQFSSTRLFVIHNLTEKCIFEGGKLHVKPLNSYHILLVFDRHSYVDSVIMEYINVMFDVLNQDGGLNGHEILPLYIHYSTMTELQQQIRTRIDEYNDIICLIGAQFREERDAIDDILVEKKKILFSIFPSGGEITYENIIQINTIPSQRLLISFHIRLSQGQKLFFVYLKNNKDCYNTYLYSQMYVENLNGEYYSLSIEDPTSTNWTELCEEIYNRTNNASDEYVLYTTLQNYTVYLLAEFKYNYPDQTMPILILDYASSMFYNLEDKKLLDGVMVSTILSEWSINEQAHLIKNQIDTFKGNSSIIFNELQLSTYIALSLMQNAITSNERLKDDGFALRTYLYNNVILSPLGDLPVTLDNHMSFTIAVSKLYDLIPTDYIAINSPSKPEPFFYLLHDEKYLTSDYSVDPPLVMVDDDIIGFAFILDITHNDESHFHFSYISQFELNAWMNRFGSVQNKYIRIELHDCPKNQKDASDLVIKLKRRKMNYLFGGCDEKTKNYLVPVIQSTDMFLFYTGYGKGNECEENVFYPFVVPNQIIYPFVTYLSTLRDQKPISILYGETDGELYEGRVNFLKSMLNTYEREILYIGKVHKRDDKSMTNEIIKSVKKMEKGGRILAFFEFTEANTFFRLFNQIVCRVYSSSEECAQVYTVYLFDASQIRYNATEASGHYVVTPFVPERTGIYDIYTGDFYSVTGNWVDPTYYDICMYSVVLQFVETLRLGTSLDNDYVKTLMFSSLVNTTLGEWIFSSNSHINQGIYIGLITSSGVITHNITLTSNYEPKPFYLEYNDVRVFECNWKDGKGSNYSVPTIVFGVQIPLTDQYFQNSIYFISGLETAFDEINMNGGIDGKYAKMYVFTSGDSEEELARRMIEYSEKYKFDYIIGGWRKSYRIKADLVAEELHKTLIVQSDYEGFECLKNTYYFGLSLNSYFILLYWIMDHEKDDIVLIQSSTTYSIALGEELKKELNVYSLAFTMEFTVPIDDIDIDGYVELTKQVATNGALIVSVLEGPASEVLITSLYDHNMKAPQYICISTELTSESVKHLGSKLVGHYFTYAIDVNDEETKKTRDDFQEEFVNRYSFVETTTVLISRSYAIGSYLSQILNKYGSNDTNVIKHSSYNTEIDTVLGKIKFKNNNQFDGKFLILTTELDDANEAITTEDYRYSYPIKNDGFLSLYNVNNNLEKCNIKDNIFGEYETIKIGLIFQYEGRDRLVSIKGLYGGITAIHEKMDSEEGTINGKIVLPVLINYDTSITDSELEEKVNDLIVENEIKVLIGCIDDDCKRLSQKVSKKNGILFMYPQKFVGQECDYDTFYTGLLPNQFVPQVLEYLITTGIDSNLGIISESDSSSITLSQIIQSQGSGMYTYTKTYTISEEKGIENDEILSVLNSFGNDEGGIIPFVINDNNNLKRFLNALENLAIDRKKYLFIDILSMKDQYNTLTNLQRHDIYLVDHYFNDIDSESNTQFKKLMNHYTYTKETTAIADSTYIAVKLWIKAVEESDTTNTNIIRDKLITISSEDALGSFAFTDSHYPSLPFYIGKYDSNGIEFSTVYSKVNQQSPMAWSWDIIETYKYMCSFAPEHNSSRYEVGSEKILLLASLTGELEEFNAGEVDVFKMAIDEINAAGGVGGKQLKGEIYDTQSNDETCVNKLKEYITTVNPKAIFFSARKACLDAAYDMIVRNNILVFFLYKYDIGSCNTNTFVANHHVSLYDPGLNVLRNRGYDEFLLAFPRDDDVEFGNYIKDYLERLKAIVYVADSLEKIDEKLDEYRQDSEDNERNVCIIFKGKAEQFVYLQDKLTEYNLKTSRMHVIVSEPSSDLILTVTNDYETLVYYSSVGNDLEANDLFKNSLFQRIDKKAVYINDVISAVYISIKLWANAINKVNDFAIDKVRKQLISDDGVLDTQEGTIGFGKNQYLGRRLTIGYKNLKYKWGVVYTAKIPHFPQAYHMKDNSFYKCDFSDLTIGTGQTISTYRIGIITSFSGKDADVEKPIFDSILAGISYLNEKDPLLNTYQLFYRVYDLQSNSSNYKSIFQQIDSDEDISYIFGGYNPDDYPIIVEEMKNRNKLFFFCGHTYSEICPKNVIVSELHPSQISTITIRRILEDTTSAITVYSPSNYTTYLNNMIQTRMSYTNILLMGDILYDLEKTNIQLRTISQAMPNGGYIIATFENKEYYIHFYKAMYELGLTYPKYTVYNTLFDENIFNDLESKYLAGHIVIGSFFESLQDMTYSSVTIPTLAESFAQGLHINIGDEMRIRTQYESAYALLIYWKNMCQASSSIEVSEVSLLYDFQTDIPSGTIELAKNNIFRRNVYSGYITEDNKIFVNWMPSKYLESHVYNQLEGPYIGYVCDWKTEKTALYNEDPIYIAFIHEIDVGGKSEQQNLLIQDMAVDEINDEGGVNGKKIIANHYFLTFNKIYPTVRTIQTETLTKSLFGCMSSRCRDEVNRYLSGARSELTFFYLGRDDGNICSEYTITTGSSINQKTIAAVEYLKKMEISNIFILGGTENQTSVVADAISKYCVKNNINFIGSFLFAATNDRSYPTLLETMSSNRIMYSTNIAYINLFSGKSTNEFINRLKSNNVDISTYIFLLFYYDSADLTKENIESISGCYITSSYSDSSTSTSAKAFVQSVNSMYLNAIELNEIFESSYSTLFLWKAGVEYAANEEGILKKTSSSSTSTNTISSESSFPSKAYLRLSMKYISYEAPNGKLEITYNNHAKKSFFIMRTLNGVLSKVYPGQGKEIKPEPQLTYMNDKECQLGKEVVLFETNSVLRYVVLVLMIILIILCISLLVCIYLFREVKLIKLSSPLFLSYELVALIMISVSGFIFTLIPNWGVCFCRVWVLALSVDFLFSILFCKAWRIHKLFNNKDLQRVKISNWMLIRIILIIEVVQCVYLTIWWVVDAAVYTETYSDNYSDFLEDVYIRECTENDIFTFIEIGGVILLFLWGAKLAWSTRKASSEFNESKTLASIIGVMIVLGILEIPLNLMMAKQPDTLMMLRGIGVELGVICIIALQFASKISLFASVLASTTFGGTSSGAGSNSDASRKTRSIAKRSANRGRFRLKPDIFIVCNIGICTISMPETFYDDPSKVSAALRLDKRKSTLKSNTFLANKSRAPSRKVTIEPRRSATKLPVIVLPQLVTPEGSEENNNTPLKTPVETFDL